MSRLVLLKSFALLLSAVIAAIGNLNPTPRAIPPSPRHYDFDNNGSKELALIVYVGSGTGISIMDLHMLVPGDGDGLEYTDFVLQGTDVHNWFTESVSAKESKSNGGGVYYIMFNDTTYAVFSDHDGADSGKLAGITFGNVIHFEYGDDEEIKVAIVLSLQFENWVMPYYVAEIHADVVFDGGGFSLKNFDLEVFEEFRTQKDFEVGEQP